ncbi:hypothetical protein EDB19DRAFT_1768123, partial [Suillus lakei]
SAMKFTSLTSVIISATAMAGVVVASSLVDPTGLPCKGTVGCSTLTGFNNGHDFGYFCTNGMMTTWSACTGKSKCHVTTGRNFVCR